MERENSSKGILEEFWCQALIPHVFFCTRSAELPCDLYCVSYAR